MAHVSTRRLAVGLVAFGILVSVIGATILVGASRARRGGRGAESFAYQSPSPSSSGELPRLWTLPALSFTDHRDMRLSREALQGKVVIADFIFTQCTNACPILTSRMVALQRRIDHPDVRFVSFSVDPAHDDVAALKAYADRWNPTEGRWSLVPTDEQKLLPALVAGFRVAAERTNDRDNPIMHSNVFFLVDGAFDVRGVYASDDPAALVRLADDAKRLAGSSGNRMSEPAARKTYASLGCAGCHDNARVAPPLVNLRGGVRMFEGQPRASVDRAYLRQSILEPGHEVVKGYLPLMPSYRNELNDSEVEALVDELLERRGAIPTAAADAELVIDPVCHMQVRTDSSAPQATHAGRTHYFCSEMCRDAFIASPSKYLE